MSAVESHVAFILDDLAKRAVAEIMKLFDNTFAAFIEELNKKQNDIDRLTKTLHSNQVVDTTGKTSDETFPTSRHGESHGNHQSAEDSQHWAMGNMGQHCLSTQVTQWDFPDEQQYIFEGINDVDEEDDEDEAHPLIEQSGEYPSVPPEGPVDWSRSGSESGEFGVMQFEIKASKSGVQVPSHSKTSEVQHKMSSVPGKRKVGRPRLNAPRTIAIKKEPASQEIPTKKPRRRPRGKRSNFPSVCSVCNEKFSRPVDLLRHRVVHNEKALLPCNWCGVTFPFRSQLMNHIRTHTGERPFSCDLCGKTFQSNSNLRIHMWSHKPKETGCSLCSADSPASLEDDTSRRRSTRPCAKCGKIKSVT